MHLLRIESQKQMLINQAPAFLQRFVAFAFFPGCYSNKYDQSRF